MGGLDEVIANVFDERGNGIDVLSLSGDA